MSPVILLEDGRLRVPAAELDREVGGIAHTTDSIGPEHPDYERLRRLAVREGSREEPNSGRQDELDRFLRENQSAGDAMLNALQRRIDQEPRRRAS